MIEPSQNMEQIIHREIIFHETDMTKGSKRVDKMKWYRLVRSAQGPFHSVRSRGSTRVNDGIVHSNETRRIEIRYVAFCLSSKRNLL